MEAKKQKVRKQDNALLDFWNWLWHSDSIWSWLAALCLAFVIVKFVFFPTLSFIFGTNLPLVVVESSSMEHPGSLLGDLFTQQKNLELWWEEKGSWYEKRDISITDAKSWPLNMGFDKGDIMIVYGRFDPEVGDVIIFNANTEHPIIHRIVSVEDGVIQTKGDNNAGQLPQEKTIREDEIIGKAVFRIPKLGWLKLIFVEIGRGIVG